VASASASDSLNCAVSGASSGRSEGRKIKDALLARETVEQVDDFAGRVKAKRVEFAPRTTLSSLAERLNDGRLPDGEVVANLESEIRKLYEVGGRRFRVALLPTEIPASREPGLRLNPQLRRIPAEMRADLTSAEIAKSGSYFDDVLRDPRRYGIENTTDKVRRPGAVRRRRDAVCTERIVGHSEKAPDGVAAEIAPVKSPVQEGYETSTTSGPGKTTPLPLVRRVAGGGGAATSQLVRL
jgi:hypothetical protein